MGKITKKTIEVIWVDIYDKKHWTNVKAYSESEAEYLVKRARKTYDMTIATGVING